ncbi:hypothetical protein [Salinispora cortesiana]|uniref:hypothetical protein n=1 Tax=Salinispora cortesiana TaxID=1305843 RepID=UPI0004719AD1|nr:hypothetical protein [Salinispora cortesiana]
MSTITAPHRVQTEWHRPLLANAVFMFTVALVSVGGLLLDDRHLVGEPVWLKPLKFGFAMGVHALVLAWLLGKLHRGRRVGWWLGTVFAFAGVLDVGAVAYAAANGTFSHFNDNSDPVARTVQALFSVGIMPLLLTTFFVAILLLIQRVGDRALTRALRAGLGLAVASMVVALWLSVAEETPRVVADANGQQVSLIGAHGIGDPDGNGMAVTGWSTTGGDLRVPHFVGMHAIQGLLLLTVALGAASARRPWLRDERTRADLVGAAALGATGLFVVLSWQAGRGQSVLHPDLASMTAFTAVAALTLAAVTGALRRARLRPLPTPS